MDLAGAWEQDILPTAKKTVRVIKFPFWALKKRIKRMKLVEQVKKSWDEYSREN